MDVFYERLKCYIEGLDIKKQAKYTIKNDTYEKILRILKSQDINMPSKFKFWSRRLFSLVRIGTSDFVYTKKTNLPLITHEQLFEKISECHIAVGHSGRDKTWAEVDIISFCSL